MQSGVVCTLFLYHFPFPYLFPYLFSFPYLTSFPSAFTDADVSQWLPLNVPGSSAQDTPAIVKLLTKGGHIESVGMVLNFGVYVFKQAE